MEPIVQKFGGTSVRNIECIQRVAEKILAVYQLGHPVVVVVSAMAGETDRLERLAFAAVSSPDPREMDVLLATGEQITISLLAMILLSKGIPAKSYTGAQVPIYTDSVHTKARISELRTQHIREDLLAGRVPIVAGFQGVDLLGDITTLGRGGSDATAVALAAALCAKECQIYTDVAGVYTADPRYVPDARLLSNITYDEMLELASQGAKVLQMRSVEIAYQYRVPLRVLSTFEEGLGTLVMDKEDPMEKSPICGLAFSQSQAAFRVTGLSSAELGVIARILIPISEAQIEIDMLAQQNLSDGSIELHFTVNRADYAQVSQILSAVTADLGASFIGDDTVSKISLVGIGLRSHVGITSKMFGILGAAGIYTQMVTTSEIKVSVVVDEKDLEPGVRALHAGFSLQSPLVEETVVLQPV